MSYTKAPRRHTGTRNNISGDRRGHGNTTGQSESGRQVETTGTVEAAEPNPRTMEATGGTRTRPEATETADGKRTAARGCGVQEPAGTAVARTTHPKAAGRQT